MNVCRIIAELAFDYELSAQALGSGRKTEPAQGRSHRLRPERLFVTSPIQGGLDYSFVWIDDVQLDDGAFIRMELAAFAIQPEERAFVIHHPGGQAKRVSLDDTDIVTARPDGAAIDYTSNTEPGSSGAPVFDRSARLIALHHASQRNHDNIQTSDGLTPNYVNEGIKLAAIALDLESRRTREATAMINLVLGEFYGSDTLTGFFGAAGRQVDADQPGAERVADLYDASAQDIDVGFWNVGWFADRHHEKADEVATMIVDLGCDIWVLAETSPAATAALVEAIERKFGLSMKYELSDPGASESKQSGAVLWNPATVDGEQLAWPPAIDKLFTALLSAACGRRAHRRRPAAGQFEAVMVSDRTRQRGHYTTEPSLKIGRYIAITRPPISTPRMTMISGSISDARPATASSTSSSKKSATLPSMASREPDSSPIATICVTRLGKTLAFCMAVVRLVPVLTSFWILRVASR